MIICDPLFREVEAAYSILGDGDMAFIIEIIEASGLTLLKEKERNTYMASFYRTEQLIYDSLGKGCFNQRMSSAKTISVLIYTQ